MNNHRLREIIRKILSEEVESRVVSLRSPGSDHYGYSATHPKKLKVRRPSLGHEEGPSDDADDFSGPVTVSRAFGASDTDDR